MKQKHVVKAILSVILTMAMIFGTVQLPFAPESVVVHADPSVVERGTCGASSNEEGESSVTWTLDNAGTLTISGTGAMRDCSGNRAPWFDFKENITSAVIDNEVTCIGSSAFESCNSLTSITIGDNVTSIADGAFSECGSLTSVTIGDGVKSIGENAFIGCIALKSIILPKSVEEVGKNIFLRCDSLETAYVPAGLTINEETNNSKIIRYSAVEVNSTEHGTVTVTGNCVPDSDTYFIVGNTATLNITPDDGCKLDSLTVTGASGTSIPVTNNSFTMPAENVTVSATFVPTSGYCGASTNVGGESSVTWTLDDTGKLTISGTGAMADYSDTDVPWKGSIDSVKSVEIAGEVTSISAYAFSNHSNLESVTIAESVTSIGKQAFYGCEKLPGINITKNVSSIGDIAFGYCTLLSAITVDGNNSTYASYDGVLFNKDKTMLICYPEKKSGDSYSIPNTVTSIGKYAFYNCIGLTTITIPDSVTSIGKDAFYNCNGLTTITIPDSVTSIGDSAFSCCSGLTAITIPDSVTSIGDSAFNCCSGLTAITIPDSVTSIGVGAFYGCSRLTTITIPDSVTSIGIYAFSDCTILQAVYAPAGLNLSASGISSQATIIEYYAVKLAPTEHGTVTVSGGDVSGNGAYFTSSRTATLTVTPDDGYVIGSVKYNDGADHILEKANDGTYSFTMPGYKHVTVSATFFVPASGYCGASTNVGGESSVTWTLDNTGKLTISGTGAMADYSDTDVPWEDSIDSVKSVEITGEVTSISACAFSYHSNLESVTIAESVTSIGGLAFYSCKKLTGIIIPKNVSSIGTNAFGYCTSLPAITVDGNNSTYASDDGVLFNKDKTMLICYPKGKSGDRYSIPDSVTSIGKYAFYNCIGLTTITIPDSVTSIGDDAFNMCKGLSSITIPDSVKSIGYGAFSYCTGLTTITIPDSVTSIGKEAFSNCSGLTTITIPDSVTSIGNKAFSGCSGLTTITIPDSVTSIGDSAFSYCGSLTTITIPDSVTSIGDSAFSTCISLTTIIIPDSVTSIGVGAFKNCYVLQTVYAPAGLSLSNCNIPQAANIINYYAAKLAPTEHGTVTVSGGDVSGNGAYFTNGGTATLTVTPDDGYVVGSVKYNDGADHNLEKANDGTYSFTMPRDKHVTVTAKFLKKTQMPVATSNLIYDGTEKTGVEAGDGYTVTGNTATNAGTYKATATLQDGYIWSDGTTKDKEIEWSIAKATPVKPADQTINCNQTLKDVKLTPGFSFADATQELKIGSNEVKLKLDTDNYEAIDNLTIIVTKKDHKYGEPVYTWSEDGKTCTAKVVCENDVTHIVSENAVVTSAVKNDSTTSSKGTTTYTATFKNELFKTQTKDVEDIPVKSGGTSGGTSGGSASGSTGGSGSSGSTGGSGSSGSTGGSGSSGSTGGSGSSGGSAGGSASNTDNKDNTEKTTTPVTEKTTNADGSVTEKTTTTNTDGSKTETSKTTAKDGTITEAEKTTAKDGTVKETEKTTATDGTVTETQKTTTTDGTVTESEKTTLTDGSVKEVEKTTSTDGTVVEKTAETDKDGSSTVSEKVTEKDGSSSETTVTVDSNGKAKSIVATDSDGKKDSQTVSFEVKGNKATVSSIDTSTGKVTIPETIEAPDGKTYTVTKLDKDAFDGQKLKELSLPETIKVINPKALENTGLKTLNLTGKNTKLKKNCLKNTNKNLVIKVTTKAEKRNIEKQLKKAGNPKAKVKVSKKK